MPSPPRTFPESDQRARVLELLKHAHKDGVARLRQRFEDGKAGGADTAAGHSYLMDQIIRVLFDAVTTYFIRRGVRTTGERLSLVALGGYGRGELAPLSDVDLLFLLPYKETPFSEQVVEFMLYILWDMGLKVGQAVRSVNENILQAKADMTIRTTLARCALDLGRPGACDGTGGALPERSRRRHRHAVCAGQARRTRRASSETGRLPLSPGAQRERRPRRLARPAYAGLDREICLRQIATRARSPI